MESTTHILQYRGKNKLYLIDMPGFDDTTRPDAVVLQEIAVTLGSLYESGVNLLGIIYFSRITDVRMGGSAIKSLRLFERLCGEESFPIVILVSTMWDQIDEELGAAKEKELEMNEELWGKMKRNGAQVERLSGDEASARRLMTDILKRKKFGVMKIQHELIDEGLSLNQTKAGQFVVDHSQLKHTQYQNELSELELSIKEARETEDDELVNLLVQQRNYLDDMLRAANSSTGHLDIGFDSLARQRAERHDPHPWERRQLEEDSTTPTNEELEDRLRLLKIELERDITQERKLAKAEKLQLQKELEREKALRKSRDEELQRFQRSRTSNFLQLFRGPPSASQPRKQPSPPKRSQTFPQKLEESQPKIAYHYRQSARIVHDQGSDLLQTTRSERRSSTVVKVEPHESHRRSRTVSPPAKAEESNAQGRRDTSTVYYASREARPSAQSYKIVHASPGARADVQPNGSFFSPVEDTPYALVQFSNVKRRYGRDSESDELRRRYYS
jgi:hypothetical protein